MNKTLFQLDTKGKVRVWSIKVVKHTDSHSDIVINAGLEDGKQVETITPITEGKSIGRANETTVYEQAVKDAETEYNKKIKKGYVEDKTKIKGKGETATINAPMKGYAYHPKGKEMKAKTLDDLKIRGRQGGFQRKLDGHRYRIIVDTFGVTTYSSSGDIVPDFPQISSCLNSMFWGLKNKLLDEERQGFEEIIFDGEIYNHELGFQAVASACGTKVHITPEKQELRDKMEFHLFDIVLDLSYSKRYEIVKNYISGPIKLVETIFDEITDENIEKYFKQFLSEGYEGVMVRTLDEPYEFKRTKQLTKFKPYIDGEYKVVGFKKSITGETLGSFECEFKDGRRFSANPMDEVGTDVARQQIWDNRDNYIGKWLNCRFMEFTDDGLPRHPRARYFRKGKSKD